jgi:hypothetical protein
MDAINAIHSRECRGNGRADSDGRDEQDSGHDDGTAARHDFAALCQVWASAETST